MRHNAAELIIKDLLDDLPLSIDLLVQIYSVWFRKFSFNSNYHTSSKSVKTAKIPIYSKWHSNTTNLGK